MFRLYDRIKSNSTYIIAEMSANHGGAFENSIKIVREVAKAGADCLKIQTYTADSLTIDCDNDYFKIKNGLWEGYKLYDLYKEAGTPYEWQAKIKDECERCGIDFLSTPFDKEGVDFLESLNVEAYKIASFELVDIPLIEYTASKGKPMIMSTGMASIEEIQDAIDACHRVGNDKIVLLKCCSEYPAPWEDMHLANIPDMKQRFNLPIGLSDHSEGSLGAVVGVSLGACVIEKHVKLNDVDSADSDFSMSIDAFAQMVQDVKNTKLMVKGPCYELTKGEKESTAFRRSIFVVEDIKAGDKFTVDNIKVIRPGYGLAPKKYNNVLGCNAVEDIRRGEPLREEHVAKIKNTEEDKLYLREAGKEDCDLLFNWANDRDTRLNSFNMEPIAYETHLVWFKNLLSDNRRVQFILMEGDNPVGQVRLDFSGTKAEISYSIDNKKRGLGYGKIIIKKIVELVRVEYPEIEELIANVKSINGISMKCFDKNGFKEKNRQYVLNMNDVM